MLNRNSIKCFLIALIVSLAIYFFIPVLIARFSSLQHPVSNFYLQLLKRTIFLLPLALLLYSIVPIRRFLDYRSCLEKLKDKHFIALTIVVSLILTNLVSYCLYDRIPQADDAPALYQAKILAEGKRWLPAPQYPEFFLEEFAASNNKWFWMKPMGHPLLLAIGVIAGVPWLICPLMAAISLIVFYSLLKNIFDPITARTGTALLMLSPTFIFVSASMKQHNTSLLFLLLSLLLVAKAMKSRRFIYPLLSGLCIGYAFFSRPQLSAVSFIVLSMFLFLGDRKSLGFFVLGFIPFFLLQLADNYLLTGSPLHYGYTLFRNPQFNALGFRHEDLARGIPGHTPLDALINLGYNGLAFSMYLFGWPLVSLAFVPIAFMKSRRPSAEDLRPVKWDRLSLALIVGSIVFWFFFWFHGVSPMGPKYYYEIVPLLVLLTARGIERVQDLQIRPLITLLVLANVCLFLPQAAKGFDKWGCNLNCYNEVKKSDLHDCIVFIRNLPADPVRTFLINRFNYLSVGFRNSVKIEEGDIIYANDLGEDKNRLLMDLYPTRKVYFFEYLDESRWHLVPGP